LAIAGANVKAVDYDTGVRFDGDTDKLGNYRLGPLVVGFYDVQALANGYRTFRTEYIQVGPSETLLLDMKLASGSNEGFLPIGGPGPPPLKAPSDSVGGIQGIVVDQDAAPVALADVTATNERTGGQTVGLSTGSGSYSIAVPTGHYTFEVVTRGFEKLIVRGIEIEPNEVSQLNLRLIAGKPNVTMVVTFLPDSNSQQTSAPMPQAVGAIRGTVTDPNGVPVANAPIAFTDTTTGTQIGTRSDASGSYAANLWVGNFNEEIVATGYKRLLDEDIKVEANKDTQLDGKLISKDTPSPNQSPAPHLAPPTPPPGR
jgi:hypothetical protein